MLSNALQIAKLLTKRAATSFSNIPFVPVADRRFALESDNERLLFSAPV